MTLYLNNVYGNRETERWFKDRWAETGKRPRRRRGKIELRGQIIEFRVEQMAVDGERELVSGFLLARA